MRSESKSKKGNRKTMAEGMVSKKVSSSSSYRNIASN